MANGRVSGEGAIMLVRGVADGAVSSVPSPAEYIVTLEDMLTAKLSTKMVVISSCYKQLLPNQGHNNEWSLLQLELLKLFQLWFKVVYRKSSSDITFLHSTLRTITVCKIVENREDILKTVYICTTQMSEQNVRTCQVMFRILLCMCLQ